MNIPENTFVNWLKSWFTKLVLTTVLTLIIFTSNFLGWQLSAVAGLAQGDAVTDPQAILRYALPIDNDSVRKLQKSLEDISNQLRGKRWKNISRDLKEANYILTARREQLLATVPDERKSQAESIINQLITGTEKLNTIVETKDREATSEARQEALELVGDLEQLMVVGFPFEVPQEYNNLPQLLGRATVAMKTNKGDLEIVVDGYSAPINAGNFIDLVQRGFYDGLDFNRAE
ncbi:MAG: peptidylprolyl isomerase, partial [Waterburya sp.]